MGPAATSEALAARVRSTVERAVGSIVKSGSEGEGTRASRRVVGEAEASEGKEREREEGGAEASSPSQQSSSKEQLQGLGKASMEEEGDRGIPVNDLHGC